jgi:cytochrome c peroxidase
VSDSLDALQEWVTTVRAPIVPQLANAAAGRAVFETNCASCHGGAKWTKSQTLPLFERQPATNSGLLAMFPQNPIGPGFFDVGGVKPFDADVSVNGPQLLSIAGNNQSNVTILDNVGTFFAANTPEGKLEIRGAAAVAGQSTQGFGAFGALGFNSPSLLGLSLSAPYLHDGSAQTLEQVAARHKITTGGNTATIQQTLSAQELTDLLNFVRSIDDETQKFDSATDAFLQQQ